MIAEIAAGVGGIAAVAGWLFAWRSRGEALDARKDANTAAERARLAEVARDAMSAAAGDADAKAAVAAMETRAATIRAGALQSELDRERREKATLYAMLEKAGVGGALVDAALDKLRADANDHRRETGASRGADPRRDQVGVPGDDPGAPSDPDAS